MHGTFKAIFFFLLKEKNVHTPVPVGSPAWFEGTFPRPLHQLAERRCGGSGGGKQAAGREGRGGRQAPGHPQQMPGAFRPPPRPAVQAGRGPVARKVCAFGSRRPFRTFSSLPRQLKPSCVTEQEELRFSGQPGPLRRGYWR